ncbi:DUF6386 family protein [Paenibacillus kribbensis]
MSIHDSYATLCVFDTEALKHRLNDDLDWCPLKRTSWVS